MRCGRRQALAPLRPQSASLQISQLSMQPRTVALSDILLQCAVQDIHFDISYSAPILQYWLERQGI